MDNKTKAKAEEEKIGSQQRSGPYTFEWTEEHLFRSKTDPLRYQYDELGARTLERLQSIAKSQDLTNKDKGTKTDLYQLLKDNHARYEELTEFWTQVNTVPEWVDWDQLERGQRFFYRYAAANLVGFALQAFVGENSAASGVVEVLVRTGGFSTRVLLHRFLETFQWLLQATASVSAIKPGGSGHESTVRVRLLHASVQQRISKLASTQQQPGRYFDVEKYGEPINTLDSIHSICTFCCNHAYLQLPRMGIFPRTQEIEDYVALFRYLAYLLGTPDSYFSSARRAKATMESMLVHELAVTETSLVVCHNFVKCLVDLPPFNISKGFIEAGSRVLNGDELCDQLEMGRPGWVSYACFQGHCWTVSALARAQRLSPKFDRWVVEHWRHLLHSAVIQNSLKGGSKFDFKYVPQFGVKVGKEGNGRNDVKHGLFSRPVEAFYLGVFLLSLAIAVATGLLAVKALTTAMPSIMIILSTAQPT